MSSVKLYRIYCTTEQAYFTKWDISPPTTCPNNNTHSATNPVVLREINQNSVYIKPETNLTNGNYRVMSYIFECPPGLSTHNLSWPYDVLITDLKFQIENVHRGDIVNGYVAPDTIIGIITSTSETPTAVLNVNDTVLTYMQIGHRVSINGQDLGECLDKNYSNNTITVENEISVTAGSFVKMSINNIKNFIMGPECFVQLNAKGSEAKTVPKNTIIRMTYDNKGENTKELWCYFEIFY